AGRQCAPRGKQGLIRNCAEYALKLADHAQHAVQGDHLPSSFPESLKDAIEDWSFETEEGSTKWGLWLHSENGGMDSVCLFVQHLLQQFDPQAKVSFEWSHDCSKPRIDAFGGGAAIITATEIKTMSTGQWIREQAA
ncbi:MAG: hypothetical protein WCO56_28020, partial [Verrucomicrobiota bacterium]